MKLGKALFCLVALTLSGCQKAHVPFAHWPSAPGKTQTAIPAALNLSKSSSSLRNMRLGHESVATTQVNVSGAVIADSWIKNIRNSRGELIYADGQIYESIPDSLHLRVKAALPKKASILETLKKGNARLAQSRWIHGPELEVAPRARLPGWRLLWRVDYLDPEEGTFWRLRSNLKGRVHSLERVSAEYVDVPATVFPKGPKASALSEVWLKELVALNQLESPKLKAISSDEPSLLVWSHQDGFKYSLEDRRFDAVQAYFYVEQAMNWFRKNTNFEFPSAMTVDVYAGGLEHPRNIACYYYGIIRLGAGDGVTYQAMARDPSVVTHEVSHAVIEAIAHFPTTGEGGSLNEAFADFFAAHILENPHMGEASYLPGPFRRSVENDLVLSSKNGGLYHDSGIVSGALWDIRKSIGATQGFQLALKTLARMNRDSTLESFKTAIQFALEGGFTAEEARNVRKILEHRGWLIIER